MEMYPIPMVPGPVRVPQAILSAMQVDYGSGDLEPEFLDLYNRTELLLRQIYATRHSMLIMTGEGMLALWSALKSTILPGERVLAIATGVFGYGIGEMASSIGAQVKTIAIPHDRTISDWSAIEQAIAEFRPKMITAVHCETPSGTLNPLAELGRLKVRYGVPLLYVDAVASAGGAELLTDEWQIDLCLGGSQKVLSAPAMAAFLTVSPPAWDIVDQVGYVGYDALKPWRAAQRDFYFPYTPNWQGVAGLHAAAKLLLDEGLEHSFARHRVVAARCREQISAMGLKIYPAPGAVPSPTVTAVHVPEGVSWAELDRRFRQHGLVVGGSYGPLAGKVFRIGHMGSQADMDLLERALEVIKMVVAGI